MKIIQIKPVSIAARTDGTVVTENITYNQADVTYNSDLYMYGGFAGQQDIFPSFAKAHEIKPIISFVGQQWSEGTQPGTVILYQGMSMGLLLAITYASEGTVVRS